MNSQVVGVQVLGPFGRIGQLRVEVLHAGPIELDIVVLFAKLSFQSVDGGERFPLLGQILGQYGDGRRNRRFFLFEQLQLIDDGFSIRLAAGCLLLQLFIALVADLR